MDTRPVGIFDSGIGGLTVVKAVKEFLPHESIVYLGDTARVPYGTRSKETVTKFALDDVNFLLEQNVKCIVIACNTVASQAYDAILSHSSVPVISVVDAGIREAIKFQNVVVLATRGTCLSHAYRSKLQSVNKSMIISEIPCPLFVPTIEEGIKEGKLIELLIEMYLSSINSMSVDAIILGCTHYPLIKQQIAKYVNASITVIDSSVAVSRSLKRVLQENNIENSSSVPHYQYFLTDVTDRFLITAQDFLKEDITRFVQQVEL